MPKHDAWTAASRAYLKELKALGTVLSSHPSLQKCNDRLRVASFGRSLFRTATDSLKLGRGNTTLSTNPALVFEAHLDKGLSKSGRTEIVIGAVSKFVDGTLEEQAVHYLILHTPSSDTDRGLKANKTYIVRKFHFDFDRNNTKKKYPTSHLQIGGKVSSRLLTHLRDPDEVELEAFNEIDVPRIPSPAFGLATVIDMALREFAEPQFKTFTDEEKWRQCVSSTEQILHSSYHGKLYEELSSASTCTNYAFHCNSVIGDL